MLKNWQFNVLFIVGVGGAVLLLIGPTIGLNFSSNPTALAGVGSILTYILTQRGSLTRKSSERKRRKNRSVYDDDEEETDAH